MYKGRKNFHHFHDTIDVLIKHTFKTVKKNRRRRERDRILILNFNFPKTRQKKF